jgi:carbamoyl-phosphate synthase small subunit
VVDDEERKTASKATWTGGELPTAALALEDGTIFTGVGFGAQGARVGELCFLTAMAGYQESLSDPSFSQQIVVFTSPHVGNVGTNDEDMESLRPLALGCVLRTLPTEPSNYRSRQSLDGWMRDHGLIGIAELDTRALTRRIRDLGAPKAALWHGPAGELDATRLVAAAQQWSGLLGLDLAAAATCSHPRSFGERGLLDGVAPPSPARPRVVVVDFGCKLNILRSLTAAGMDVVVVPCHTRFEDLLALEPRGVLLSNGPGDPAATARQCMPLLEGLLASSLPLFGICLGHQLVGLALGGRTEKMRLGHRGANHPVVELSTGRVQITSQNHGFAIVDGSLPAHVEITHRSLFDQSVEGLRLLERPVFSVQFHPESSPGPHDAAGLFSQFRAMVENNA